MSKKDELIDELKAKNYSLFARITFADGLITAYRIDNENQAKEIAELKKDIAHAMLDGMLIEGLNQITMNGKRGTRND